MEQAAAELHGMGAANVLIKGGICPKEPIDVLFDGRGYHHFSAERIFTSNTHGPAAAHLP
jgi:hydroxymethylpyrimidine/phosphomethylpyrimidine kinase